MGKVRMLQIVFMAVQLAAAVCLTVAVFGTKNMDFISISALVIGAGLLGNVLCAVIRAVQEQKRVERRRPTAPGSGQKELRRGSDMRAKKSARPQRRAAE